MNRQKLLRLFENNDAGSYLTLNKQEISDDNFIKLLGIKTSEINIILARVVEFIKNEDNTKIRKDYINDILDVLERSATARQFVGIGLNKDYSLFKGFPVRNGDTYSHMPEPNSEMNLKPTEIYIGWTTDIEKSREDAVKYDTSKGEPIGGLLVNVHVDSSKLLFDINSVIRVVKSKYNLITKYNQMAAPGKSLSKNNTEYLSKNAPEYRGMWEVVTTNKIVNVIIKDKWVWDNPESGEKKVKWIASNSPEKQETQQQPVPQPNQTNVPNNTQGELDKEFTESKTNLQEKIKKLFENEQHIFNSDETTIEISESLIQETLWQGLKNVLEKTFGTLRGKRIKYLEAMEKMYNSELQYLKNAEEFHNSVKDLEISKIATEKIKNTQDNLQKISLILNDVKTGLEYEDVIKKSDNLEVSNAQPNDTMQNKDMNLEKSDIDLINLVTNSK